MKIYTVLAYFSNGEINYNYIKSFKTLSEAEDYFHTIQKAEIICSELF